MTPLTSYYTQNFEDVLLSRVLADINDGIYIDVGCHHEEQDSVTKHFYGRGWSGINLDPVAEHIREYACRDRDISLAYAAGSSRGTMPFTMVEQSGLSSFHTSHVECAKAHGLSKVQKRLVEVRTLNSIIQEYLPEISEFAFLKIDVEGHEYDVLQGIDLHRYRPIVILAETTKPCSSELVEDFQAITSHICAHNYQEVYFDGINTWWLKAEQVQHLAYRFQYPPGVFDGYSPYQIRNELLAREAELHKLRTEVSDLVTSLSHSKAGPMRRLAQFLL